MSDKLNEAKQVGLLYHFTTIESLLAILDMNTLMSLGFDAISLTRNKHKFNSTDSQYFSTESCLILDGNKLSNNHKIKPYNYFGDKKFYSGEEVPPENWEQEERVLDKDIENIKDYIVGIIIDYDKMTSEYKNNAGEKFKNVFYQIKSLTNKPIMAYKQGKYYHITF